MTKIEIKDNQYKNQILYLLRDDFSWDTNEMFSVFYIDYSYIKIVKTNEANKESCIYLVNDDKIKDILHDYLYKKDMIEYCIVDSEKEPKLYNRILKRFRILAPNVETKGLELIWVKDSRDNYIYKEKNSEEWQYLRI